MLLKWIPFEYGAGRERRVATSYSIRLRLRNDVSANGYGILLSASRGNLVIRNSAKGNMTNYNIEAGNTVAPIIPSAGMGTNTNPYANLSY